MIIYTIGHSNYSIEKLINKLKRHNIDVVVDIRGIPYSKYNTQFDKELLKITLIKAGFKYIYMGIELAANRISKVSYNEEGYCDFEKAIAEENFIDAVERLKNGINKGYKIALLGAMQDPIRCHRAIMVGRFLRDNGFDVRHILDSDLEVPQEYIEEDLLNKYFPNRNQITIDDLLGSNKDESEMIKEGYRLANRDIGYRLEGLDKKNK